MFQDDQYYGKTWWFDEKGVPIYAECRVRTDGDILLTGSSSILAHSEVGNFDYYRSVGRELDSLGYLDETIPYDMVDEEIRSLVRAFNSIEGVETVMSCAGHKDGDPPWVMFKCRDLQTVGRLEFTLTKLLPDREGFYIGASHPGRPSSGYVLFNFVYLEKGKTIVEVHKFLDELAIAIGSYDFEGEYRKWCDHIDNTKEFFGEVWEDDK